VSRAVDLIAIVLFLAAAGAFGWGVHSLGAGADFRAIYLLVVGGLALKAATELLRPKSAS
jgi:hypothetical protein